jgi:outer membrane protein W
MISKRVKICVYIFLFFLSSLNVQSAVKFGAQGGYSSGPDQIFGGIRVDIGTLIPTWNIVGVADLGIGEDITLLSVSGDIQFGIFTAGTISPYVGVGVGYNWNLGGSSKGIGINFPIGLKFGGKFFVEARVGLENSPDFKLGVGLFF